MINKSQKLTIDENTHLFNDLAAIVK